MSPVDMILETGCESIVKSASFSEPAPVSNDIVRRELLSIVSNSNHAFNH